MIGRNVKIVAKMNKWKRQGKRKGEMMGRKAEILAKMNEGEKQGKR